MAIFADDMTFLLRFGKPGAWLFHKIKARSLRNRTVTIISNNCWGGFMHRWYGLRFNTPFIGLFIVAADYISLLSTPSRLYAPLRFTTRDKSRTGSLYPALHNYPVGVFPTGEEIHFMHYKSEQEAKEKWEKRLARINWNNAIVKFSDNDFCSPELIRQFAALPFEHKVCFTAAGYPDLNCVVTLPGFSRAGKVKSCWRTCERHWDFVSHVNAITE